jgi:hypothetical protein
MFSRCGTHFEPSSPLSDNAVALAGGVFKFLAVHDLHCTTGVFDQPLLLQNTGGQANARPICPSIVARKSWVMGSAPESTLSRVISNHRARRCFISCSRLHAAVCATCILRTNCIAVQHQLQLWSRFQRILQSSNFYPKSVPRDLNHRPQRTPP